MTGVPSSSKADSAADPLRGLRLHTGAPEALARSLGERPRLIVTPNLDHWRLLHRSRAFRAAYRAAAVVVNDSRFLRRALWRPDTPTLPGADLALRMLDAAPAGSAVLVIGCPPGVEAWLRARRPQLRLDVVEPSRGYVFKRAERRALAALAQALRPQRIFVCTGAPQSEVVAAGLLRALDHPCDILCCGAGLLFAAGLKPRAPRWVQALGLEWAWRLAGEPHTRGRYLLDAVFLATHLRRLKALAPRGPGPSGPRALAPAQA